MRSHCKVHILYHFVDGPWGGANQFLKALRNTWREQDRYAETLNDADAILFNHFPFRNEHFFELLYELKINQPDVPILYRVDGPFIDVRGSDFALDKVTGYFASHFADGIIYQSNWSKRRNLELGYPTHIPTVIINNAPDPRLFYPAKGPHLIKGLKLCLISSSWSPNWRKGFDVFQWIDQNLDWSCFDMHFVGQTPISFTNIKHIGPVSSDELAELLRQHHVYIAASRNEPCSNALLEALHCGLPCIARDDSSYSELVKGGGLLFKDVEEIPMLLSQLAADYASFRSAIQVTPLPSIVDEYYQFVLNAKEQLTDGENEKSVTLDKLKTLQKMISEWRGENQQKSTSFFKIWNMLSRAAGRTFRRLNRQ